MRVFTEFFVNNLAASRAFYTHVMAFSVGRDEDDFVELRRGVVQLHLLPLSDLPTALRNGESCSLGARVEFCLEVPHLKELEVERRRIEGQGWPLESTICLQSWGKHDFRLLDPDGAYLRITTPVLRQNDARPGHTGLFSAMRLRFPWIRSMQQ
ncbi:MAG: hypothetical protein SGI91_15260 [Alphaproteobacteria bacterium]|nr:hypothetical protein [Alphaproteobacteria bacterium]